MNVYQKTLVLLLCPFVLFAQKKAVKKNATLTKVKSILKHDHVRLKHGYNLTNGNVRSIGTNKNILGRIHNLTKFYI